LSSVCLPYNRIEDSQGEAEALNKALPCDTLTQKMRLKKKLRRHMKKDLYLRHLCEVTRDSNRRIFYDWRMEIISS